MPNRRLLFTAIIKLLILLGLLVMIWVFINSLFSKDERISVTVSKDVPILTLDLSEMKKGQIKKVRWDNKEVAILSRQNLSILKTIENSEFKEKLHPSINVQTRSIRPEYFVYFNAGDSSNCPLFYAAGELKDVCTSNKFDETGRGLKLSLNDFVLKIPPHYFENTKLIIGKWNPN